MNSGGSQYQEFQVSAANHHDSIPTRKYTHTRYFHKFNAIIPLSRKCRGSNQASR